MSTVCYCGQPDCPVTTWERDACVANLRTERDALKAQVEAARKVLARYGRHDPSASREYRQGCDDVRLDVLDAMDEAAK